LESVTLGGSGHEPGLSGFVGEGMLDVSVAGEIFAAPGAPRCIEAIRLADYGAGVLFIVLNHAGDVLSANITMDMAKREGLNVKMTLTHEDISGGTDPEDRRGAGGVPAGIQSGRSRRRSRAVRWMPVTRLQSAWAAICERWQWPCRRPCTLQPGSRFRDGR
jgi:hypothetical protein